MKSPLAGKPAPPDILIDPEALVRAYHDLVPDPKEPRQRVAFGTSGHRGSPLDTAFNERHVVAIAQALCDYRTKEGIDGPLFLGKDTHGASEPAERTVLEVLAANGVETVLSKGEPYTPTPTASRAILVHNRGRTSRLADGVVLTPSHNPPRDGGIKYNPPSGGPADSAVTQWIEDRANELLEADLAGVKRIAWQAARSSACVREEDIAGAYIDELGAVIDLDAIRGAKLKLGAHPLGGAAVNFWGRIAEKHGLDIEVVDATVDPRFAMLPVDHDGKIRMDCSSPYAMAGLVGLGAKYRVAFGNDTDADRHGIVVPGRGLLNPNHYLAVCIRYLFTHRPAWRGDLAVGKTIVSSSMIDRVTAALGRRLAEVPVGFKYFVPGLAGGMLGFAGEESAGGTLLRREGTPWTTDKDGIVLCLLAAEMTATTGKDPGELYAELTAEFGAPAYTRIDSPVTKEQKVAFKKLGHDTVRATNLAGHPIVRVETHTQGENLAIGGIKVSTEQGWFAARPSGTEDVYKLYAESFLGDAHLQELIGAARALLAEALA